MLPIRIDVRQKPPEVRARAWRAATKAGFAAGGAQWHREMLPQHFRPGAAGRYGYRLRSRKYLERKIRAASRGQAADGGRTPLVYTGLMRSLLLGTQFVRAYPLRSTVRMLGPRYITMRVVEANQPDKAKEVTTLLASEKRQIAQTIHRTIRDQLRRTQGKK